MGSTNFKEIQTVEELIAYLESDALDKDYIYQYTNRDALFGILNSKTIFLGNLRNLNDIQEYNHTKKTLKENAYVACLTREEDESIAMWAMYGNPWDKAVRIGFPVKKLRQCLKNPIVYEVMPNFKLGKRIEVSKENIKLLNIGYVHPQTLTLHFSNKSLDVSANQAFAGLEKNPKVQGYLKHKAWLYESETRILARQVFGNYDRIALQLSNEVLQNLKVMTGPDFSNRLRNKLEKTIRFEESEFKGLVRLKDILRNSDDES